MRETPQRIIYKSKNWKDFEKKISKLNEKDRGTVFEWLCVFYLQIHPVYKAVYKRVLHSTEFLKENEGTTNPRASLFCKILGIHMLGFWTASTALFSISCWKLLEAFS